MPPSDSEEADAAHRRFHSVGKSSTDSNLGSKDHFGGSGKTEDDENENSGIVIASSSTPLNFEHADYGSTVLDLTGTVKQDAQQSSPMKSPPFKEEQFGFDFRFLKRFYRLHGLLFISLCSVSTLLFVFLLCLVLLQEYVVYQVGLIASGYYKTLGDKDLPGFWIQTRNSVGLILAVSFIKSSTQYTQKILTVTFRKFLCRAAHRIYFADIHFYQLNVLDKAIDNPDQRMTQDIDKFCSTYCEVLPRLIVSPFTIGYYCYQGYLRSGWQGPVGCFGFFLASTCFNKFLMTPIVRYVVKQEKCEGDFRFLHMLVRVYSESIAFQQASLVEGAKVEDALDNLLQTQHSLYLRQYILSFSVNFIDYIGSIFSYLMLAIPIFSGQYDNLSPSELGSLISQNAFILIYLIFTFTNLVNISGQFTDIAGVTHRIAQLLERLNALEDFWKDLYPDEFERTMSSTALFEHWIRRRQKQSELSAYNRSNTNEKGSNTQNDTFANDGVKLPIWTLENLSFSQPMREEPLVTNLNLQLVVGESLLITGSSSTGKTSILRVLRGLWPHTDGHLKRHYPPGPHGVYFCPQKGYLTLGTLREQISFPLYPDLKQKDDKLILYYIEQLRLNSIVERVGGLDVACSWSVFDSLSPGEMQRLCILRIFYHRPVVAVLDEVTSALSLDMEEFVYTELKRLGITLISVGHRESIRKYHDKQLILTGDSGWELYSID
ncbi:ATP-binding cassette sub-family D member 4 [Orchesella cincta]|uniref:ATP-binding cassette sub-family D member 4 n=1 Tax=Orchesella cincta TaxID=48709 RepID=A0A1D2N1E0_ORCCI|nr:ATP-binding cassette sub-family D member 4 [Orchesella cincta]